MKYKAILPVLATVIVIGTVFILAGRSGKKTSEPPSEKSKFHLAVLDSDVSVKTLSAQDFSTIANEADVFQGDTVKTSATGRGAILQPDGTIANLGKNSVTVLSEINPAQEQSRINLVGGSIWSKVQRLTGGKNYQVETENMVASVRGTAFAVIFADHTTSLLVLEGIVRAQVKNPLTGKLIEGLEKDIPAGYKILVDSGHLPANLGDMLVQQITQDDFNLQIIKDNYVRGTSEPSKSASPTPTVKSSPIPTLQKSTSPSPGSLLSATPSVNPTTTAMPATPTPQPTPTPTPETSILSVTPKILDRSQGSQFAINGQKLFGVKKVLLNQTEISFIVIDESTIFGTAGANIEPGVYDVSVVTSSGKTLTLYYALTIR